jgi:hypothetical protein
MRIHVRVGSILLKTILSLPASNIRRIAADLGVGVGTVLRITCSFAGAE